MTTARTLKSEQLFSGKIFDVVRDTAELSTDKTITVDTLVKFDAVVIIPVTDDGNLVLVNQYRHCTEQTLLELPAGTLEIDEDPKDCAHRELQEETGYDAETLTEIGMFYPAPGFCTEKQFGYVAKGLFESELPMDDDEVIEKVIISKLDFEKKIAQGELVDGKTSAFYFKAKLLGLI